MRAAGVVGVALIAVVACGPGPSARPGVDPASTLPTEATEPAGPTPTEAVQRPAPPRVCEAERGSPTDVANEPDWRRWGDYDDWTTDDGCLVRIDVLASRPGPEHCGYQDVRVLITGDPLGRPTRTAADSVTYIRDPGGVFGDPRLSRGFRAEVDLPDAAQDTGYRLGDVELWLSDSGNAAYLLDGGVAERWPRGDDLPCA